MSYFETHYGSLSLPIENDKTPGFRTPQLGAIHAVASHFTLRDESAIVTMPTGSGKTAVLMACAFLLRATRVLVVTPSRLVRGQIGAEFSSLGVLRGLGAISDDVENPNVVEVERRIGSRAAWRALRKADVVIGTPQSVSPATSGVAPAPESMFDLILVDEAHHTPARTWNALLETFGDARRVLFTATPFRRDRKEIRGRFVYTYTARRAFDDGVFGAVEFRAVTASDDEIDTAIAREAEKTLRADRDNQLAHYLLVRTDSKKRAHELRDLYQEVTDLKLRLIHSGHSTAHIKNVVRKLREHELDGLICVDMLGEGFDFPNLKIAAIHAPHKSLAVTLQFIGRFARTTAPDIGSAKFLAAPAAITLEARRLYEEGAVWEKIIIELGDSRIEQELRTRETLEKFERVDNLDFETEDLSLYSLEPYHHVKIYRTANDVDVGAEVDLGPASQILHREVSVELHATVFVAREITQPRWTDSDIFARVVHDLFVVYYDKAAGLLFICASRRSLTLYELIAEQFTGGLHEILPLEHLNRVLRDGTNVEFWNVGMRNRVASSNTESYRIMTGPSVDKAIRSSDSRLFHRGHCFGGTTEGNVRGTIGLSSSSKIWRNKSTQIPDLIAWCAKLGQKIRRAGETITGSGWDRLPMDEVVEKIPSSPVGVDWDSDVYKYGATVCCTVGGGQVRRVELLDLELRLKTPGIESQVIELLLEGPDLMWPFSFSLGQTPHFRRSKGAAKNVIVVWRDEEIELQKFVNAIGVYFYLADFSRLDGNRLLRAVPGPVLPRQCIDTLDWKGEGVEITREIGDPGEGKVSVHDYLLRVETESKVDVVFYDHGSGECADVVTVEDTGGSVLVSLYHCKGSGGARPGNRVDDVYEVAGQVVKSTRWIQRGSKLGEQLIRRSKGTQSRFEKGDAELLTTLLAQAKPQEFIIVLVQPGISKVGLGDKIEEILSAASDYVNGGGGAMRVLCSE